MIAIGFDLNYLARYLHVSSEKLETYKNKTLEEILETEALHGNSAAETYLLKVVHDQESIMRIFQLGNAENRWQILKEMNHDDLSYILQFIKPEDMAMGLQFFNKEGLLTLLSEAPQEEIVNVVLSCYSKEDFIKLIPEKELDKWFESTEIDRKDIFKHLGNLEPEALAQMIEGVTGTSQKDAKFDEMIKTIQGFNEKQFYQGLKFMKPEYKQGLILSMTEETPKLWQEFEANTLIHPLEYLQKGNIMEGMTQLEPKTMMRSVQQLPPELLAVVVTQIEPEQFAKILGSRFSELLKQVVCV